MKRILSVLLVVILVLSMGTTAFASPELNLNDDDFSITQLSATSYLMTNENETRIMTVEETATEITLTIESEVNDEVDGFFYVDKVDGSIYSSYTCNTISVAEISSDNGIQPLAVGDVVARTTHNISYSNLASLVLPTSSQFAIAGAIITIIAAAQGVVIATAAAVVISLISTGMWDTLRNGIISKSTNHGVRSVVATVEIRKHQGGGFVTGYTYKIESVSLY